MLKRGFDFSIALALLVVLSPLLALLALTVRVKLGRPVLFTQVRPGRQGTPFEFYKFRTMTVARDAAGELLPDAARLTPFGELMRKSSLDELPQLVNVLKGDMSLVGPRPLLMEYLPLYSERQSKRHAVRPGMTGWAQVNGRNSLTWEERLNSTSGTWNTIVPLDLKVIAMTLWHAAAAGFATGARYHDQVHRVATRQGKLKASEKLLLFGAGGHAKVVIDIVEQQGNFEIAGLLDDDPRHQGKGLFGYPVLGTRAELPALRSAQLCHAIVTIGDNAMRAAVAAHLHQLGWRFASAIHPRASISRGVSIGPGSVVMAGCVINADASLGGHVIVNSGATVDHDCRIEDAVHIAPGCHLCGGVSVGPGTLLGAGTTVTPGVSIG